MTDGMACLKFLSMTSILRLSGSNSPAKVSGIHNIPHFLPSTLLFFQPMLNLHASHEEITT